MPLSRPTAPRGRPRAAALAERGIDTRQNILDAFTHLVAQRGYQATSISSIAEAAGVTKGTVVHHFATKDHMMQEAQTQYFLRRVEEFSRILAEVDDPELQLTAAIYLTIRAHRDDRAGTVAFMREYAHYLFAEMTPELQTLRSEYAALMVGIVRKGEAKGVFAVKNARLTSLQIFGMVNHLWTWYRPEQSESAEEITAQFAHNILYGVVSARSGTDRSVEDLAVFLHTLKPWLAPVQTYAPSRFTASEAERDT